MIATVTSKRLMPPWKPEPGYGRFQNERKLSDRDIATIRRWAAAGAPEGDRGHLPPPPEFNEAWRLGEPDLVVRMTRPFPIPADGPDIYQCFVIPLPLDRNRYVRALEFQPLNRKVVHHALLFTDASGSARARDTGSGYPCFGVPGFLPTSALGGWSPGNRGITLPDDIALPVQKGADLVVQMHFHPTGKPETECSSIGFHFTGKAPTRRIMDVALGSRRIDIPAGDASYKVTDHFTLPVNVHATGIIPHAHYVCREMRAWAVLPNGRKRWLIRIRDWDFNWQEQYRYAEPVALPEGTRLEMEFTYDNSAANPRNPNSPPKRVTWGPATTDEMAGLHVQVIPDDMSEAQELGRALWGKIMREVGGKFYRGPAPRP